MTQYEFTKALLQAARSEGLHTCLDTNGYAPLKRYLEIMQHVDLFLYDIKETDPDRHREHTGVDNQSILDNLFELDDAGAQINLRCPIIPGLDDRNDHFAALGEIASQCRNLKQVELLPFHPYGSSLSERINREYTLGHVTAADKDRVKSWVERIRAYSAVPVR